MIHFIYALPLLPVCAAMPLLVLMWAHVRLWLGRSSAWRKFNAMLVIFSVAAILRATIIGRSGGGELRLLPFHLFNAEPIPIEYFRSLIMNVLLFLPFGLSLSAALPSRWPVKKSIGRTLLAAAALSVLIELTQLCFSLGTVETDDVLMNSLGAALGAFHLCLADLLARARGRLE